MAKAKSTKPKVKLIKHDAIIDIKIGTGFLQKLQQMLVFMTADLSPEDLELYRKLNEENNGFTEPWMDHLTTLSVLLKEIETKAEEQGFTYEGDIEDTIIPRES
jgi:hypothetical protein